MDERRQRALNEHPIEITGPVVYWMSRDQRVHDNWTLIHAQQMAKEFKRPLIVLFTLVPQFLGATRRQYDFMLRGLEEVEHTLRELGISFVLREGDPKQAAIQFIETTNPSLVVVDFDPLRIKRSWREGVAKKVNCKMVEVDAHNIVPAWFVSQKVEYGAYTLRPKIHKLLKEFLAPFARVEKHPYPLAKKNKSVDWKHVHRWVKVDDTVPPVDWCTPGERAANRALNTFLDERLSQYDAGRNDPLKQAQSDLSPYLHFGQLSAQRIALLVHRADAPLADKEAFLEELIVRRELADNYCLYNPHYDSLLGIPDWAKRTLDAHRNDKREYVYTKEQFERGATHDALWNAAQQEMIKRGKMHGYMRMYWAKKIFEWTKTPEEAFAIACYLNDKYELDGRDPNGYVGVAWSIGGVHDRAWFERPIFGQIRYMNASGCKKKFDVARYISDWGEGDRGLFGLST